MNASSKTILCVAGDPGGAAALAPVIQILDARLPLQLAAYKQALALWRLNSENVCDLGDSPSLEDAARFLMRVQPALIVTATSVNGVDWECYLLQAARQLKIPALSILDFWSNYSRRFSLKMPLDSLPQQICVMDARAVGEMRAEGFPEEMLLITGQPALDAATEPLPAAQLLAARNVWPAKDRRLLFVSQPLSALYGGPEECLATLGYNEQSVLSLVESVVTQLVDQGCALSLKILPHPRESAKNFVAAGFAVAKGFSAKVIVQAADIVIGMNSMLLLEAAAAGCVVVSVQPNLQRPDSLGINQSGVIVPVYHEAQLLPVLTSLLGDSELYQHQQKLALKVAGDGKAANRVVGCIERLLASSVK